MEDIQSRLQPDELLIEFVAYQPIATGHSLLDRAGGPQWSDLGAAGPIDRAVQDLIAAANDWSCRARPQ